MFYTPGVTTDICVIAGVHEIGYTTVTEQRCLTGAA